MKYIHTLNTYKLKSYQNPTNHYIYYSFFRHHSWNEILKEEMKNARKKKFQKQPKSAMHAIYRKTTKN